MTSVYRLIYAGVCEVWVETVDNGVISKVLAASASDHLIGHTLDDLPQPRYAEARLIATYGYGATLPSPSEGIKTGQPHD